MVRGLATMRGEVARHRILAGVATTCLGGVGADRSECRATSIFAPRWQFGISGKQCSSLPFGRAGWSLGTSPAPLSALEASSNVVIRQVVLIRSSRA